MKLKQRLLMLGAAGLMAACVIGLVGWFGQKMLLDSAARQSGAAKAVRAQMQVDMMHDALNADVLAALLAANGPVDAARNAEIRSGLEEHIEAIKGALSALRASALDADLQQQLSVVGPQVETYAAEAIAIVDLAGSDLREANARLPAFHAAFSALEGSLEGVGDAIEALIARQTAAGEAVGNQVTIAQFGSLAVLAALLAGLSLAVTRRITAQLGADPSDAGAVADRIAGGTLDRAVEGADAYPASVMAALSRMQDELRRRAAVAAENSGQLAAINRAQAVIEFDLDGTIRHANAIFLKTFGYALADIVGKPHSMLCDAAEVSASDYALHWNRLRRGEFIAGRFRRIARDGHEVWLEASYNALLDAAGNPVKVVKYARDISGEVATEAEVARIVAAAARGDFTQRVSLDGKTGFFLALATSINQLLETSAVGLGEVVRVLDALARGDLTETITAEYHGTFGQLKRDSNQTVEQLSRLVSAIKQSTDAIHTAAAEIAAGNQDLSSRTEQQAASLQETASSMEELTTTVRQNADSARKASHLASTASDVALRGGQVVSDVVTTMGAIHESSRKIVDIISVIDGIAFQTNILALNAAVEAARAGEQGRGFAVVASEVRSLAQRSATAAKEIKTLIGDSVEKVGNGAKLVEEAGRTMGEVVGSVRQVTEIISAISAASEEQSTGIEQVNLAISQMDQVTQQNAALVEQASASAHALAEQAGNLTGTVSTFRLDASRLPTAASDETLLPHRSVPIRGASPARSKLMTRRATSPSAAAMPSKVAGGHGAGDVWTEF